MEDMKTDNKDRGAFACVDSSYLQVGLTKREYFASQAMVGLLAGGGYTASTAIIVADRLIKALNK